MDLLASIWYWIKDFFFYKGGCELEKHIWVGDIQDERFDNEIHSNQMNKELHENCCRVFNLIPDNVHEGIGWWEAVEVKRTIGFTEEESKDVIQVLSFSDAPVSHQTWLPLEVLNDIEKAPDRVIGFRPHKSTEGQPTTVVWIHYS